MIDPDGYRLNVGIILCNDEGRVFWARRLGMRSWQFPQGGIKFNEDPQSAMYRELYEEVGLRYRDVKIIARTRDWLRYDLPERYIRKHSYPLCIGQKQLWFMLRLRASESRIRLNRTAKPEFDHWCWVDYWYPVSDVVYFKRQVYRQALTELGNHLAPGKPARAPAAPLPTGPRIVVQEG
ncbi:putative (di)nucleoside polyphosphate hydrolase [Methylomagnum ishizawai]|uniref:RNA pyrophosphohydrolase n=1 Tax=Methylomagnum ishizawai TaxID=1760988 RepID=A0A1Y6CZ44_9GAMM|nr:RNA pyrophosphohydrolase [Methylomagnum ishizawai]SMF95959.1 putative (di)nucleoside polyphosphate hydrolase [Methylomagnum ishizawai]